MAQTFAWNQVYGSATFDQAIDVATDTNDNVYVVGYFNASIDFDPGPGEVTKTSNGSNDIFVQKLDADGNLVWVETFGGTGSDQAATVDVDSTGNVYVGGAFRNSVGLGSGLAATTLTSVGSEDAFLIKLDSAGGFLWARGWGSTNGDIANGVAVAPGGDVAVAGWFSETMDLDSGAPVNDAPVQGALISGLSVSIRMATTCGGTPSAIPIPTSRAISPWMMTATCSWQAISAGG